MGHELQASADVLFMMLGAVMVFAMHGGFAFLEVGTVRRKSQVNALMKILSDWSFSTIAYFFIGFPIAYGITFFGGAAELIGSNQGFDLVRFFFLLTFAAAIPAIISGGIAERAKFWPQVMAAVVFVAFVYPFFERMIWGIGTEGGLQEWLTALTGEGLHDYAGSIVVHSMGGWLALPAILLLGPRKGRYRDGKSQFIPVSNIPFLALGSWMLAVGWFGFNVMSAQSLVGISGLVAMNSLFAMVGGVIAALVFSKNDPGFVHNGALAGLVAVCAGSDIMHPLGALATGAIAGGLFIVAFLYANEKWKIDDVLGVWPLHGVCGTWGGIAAGIFGQQALGGLGGVSLISQTIGALAAIIVAVVASYIVYAVLKKTVGIRMDEEAEYRGADVAIHNIGAYPEDAVKVARS
ncbi:ammonium transporter [Chrysiogenes arsenatis]|uniref:ammonium transporter n=1 Tax=Chrysiogenes arsenatis TaxID=309797 RepID=UPI0003F8AF03|nr:ammonium transporter [Chrysiogenes arsenatis]